MSFNESNSFNQYYPKGNIGHFDTMSSQYANAFERFEYESQTITNDRMSEYQVPQTSAKYSFPTVGSDTEVLEIDTKNHFPLLQAYNSEEIPKLLVESCDPIEENTELKQKNLQKGSVTLSVVGECIRTACDILLGIYPWNTDHLFVNTDSQFMSLISSDSKKESSFSEAELWDRNVQNNTENKCKKLKSDNNLFKHGSGLSKSLRYNSSKPLTEERNCETSIKKYRICEQNLSARDNKTKHSREKMFQCDICQQMFTRKDNLNRHLGTHSGVKSFRCEVCHHMFSQKSHLNCHMLTHSGEKHFQCEVCQRKFTRKQNLQVHMRTHNGEKPFHCEVCQQRFTQKHRLLTHMRTHNGEK